MIVELLRWWLLVWGSTYLLTSSMILSPLRMRITPWGDDPVDIWIRTLIYCPACMGTWVGFVLVHRWPFDGGPLWLRMLESGIAAMAAGLVLGHIQGADAAEAEQQVMQEDVDGTQG